MSSVLGDFEVRFSDMGNKVDQSSYLNIWGYRCILFGDKCNRETTQESLSNSINTVHSDGSTQKINMGNTEIERDRER